MNENSMIASIALVIGLVFGMLIYSITSYNTKIATDAIKAGLVQGAVEGQPGIHWIKPRN